MDHTTAMRGSLTLPSPDGSKVRGARPQTKSWLGTLFKVEDYPGMRDEGGRLRFTVPEELRSSCAFETKVLPLPDADDFRVSIGEQDRERIKRQIAESIQGSVRVGTRELWQRLYKVVSHMSQRMTEYNATQDGNKPRLYDSMITNIVEIVDVLPKLNRYAAARSLST